MHKLAFEALYAAADTIRKFPGVRSCTCESDRKSGEIIFDLVAEKGSGNYYMLRLESFEEEDE